MLDVDPQHGGETSFKKQTEKYGELPKTVESLTGGGGRHIYFLHPGKGIKVRNKVGLGKLYPGLDIRGDGGCIVAPPSLHESRNKYTWKKGCHFNSHELAPIPKWLLKLITRIDKNKSFGTVSKKIQEGSRNNALTSLAGKMRKIGLEYNEIFAALKSYNKDECVPPLNEEEVKSIAKSIIRYTIGSASKPSKSTSLTKNANTIEKLPLESPDPTFKRQILFCLFKKSEDLKKLTQDEIRHMVGKKLLKWLSDKGGFCKSETENLFYFYRANKSLFNLETHYWQAWLHSLTGANPAGTDFAYFNALCKSAALMSEKRKIVKFSYWDEKTQILYVSRFDGTVYKIDGQNINEEVNGENILFENDPDLIPYKPVFKGSSSKLTEFSLRVPNWENEEEMYALALHAWILSTFFIELCPTRPLLVLIGEKGSGKSMTLRLILRLFFGHLGEVRGVPDKPDGFTAMVSASHLLVIDNLDDPVFWMRDKLARLSTGAVDEYRKLYTSNEVGHVRYRCWVAFTARTPDTLKRDDISDRLLLLPVKRIDENKQKPERIFLKQVESIRNKWWGDVLEALLKIVAAIKEGQLKKHSLLRMADWESLGRLTAKIEGKEELWGVFVDKLQRSQSKFLLEGDPICDAIEKWLAKTEQEDALDYEEKKLPKLINYEKKLTARELYNELTFALFGSDTPRGWYKSTQSFAKKLSTIRTDLRKEYGLRWESGTNKANKNRLIYWFEKKKMSNQDISKG